MNIIKDDFTMKLVSVFALLLVGFGGGGLIGFMFASLAPISPQIDIGKTTDLGAVIGIGLSLLMALHTIYTDFRDHKMKE